jgi:hypothetical protein
LVAACISSNHGTTSLLAHIFCCRCVRSEAKLAEAFDFLAGQLRSVHKLPVSYVALDWHQMDKELGSEALVEAFWTQLSALLPPQV